jgi:hypothetical protein
MYLKVIPYSTSTVEIAVVRIFSARIVHSFERKEYMLSLGQFPEVIIVAHAISRISC